MPSSHLILCPSHPFSSCLQSFPASGSFPRSQFFASGGQSIGFQLQHQSFQWIFRTYFLQDGLVVSPCSPRDPQESSPTPQFKSINSSALSFLYSPTLTPIHDYWKVLYTESPWSPYFWFLPYSLCSIWLLAMIMNYYLGNHLIRKLTSHQK